MNAWSRVSVSFGLKSGGRTHKYGLEIASGFIWLEKSTFNLNSHVSLYIYIYIYIHGRHLTHKSGGARKKKKYIYILDVAYASNNALHCNALCQYSAVKNPLTECLFTLSANSPSCWQRLFTLTAPTNV